MKLPNQIFDSFNVFIFALKCWKIYVDKFSKKSVINQKKHIEIWNQQKHEKTIWAYLHKCGMYKCTHQSWKPFSIQNSENTSKAHLTFKTYASSLKFQIHRDYLRFLQHFELFLEIFFVSQTLWIFKISPKNFNNQINWF